MEQLDVEILLIEDNVNDAEMTLRAFRKNNVTNKILHLKDGAEALDFIFGTGQYEGRSIIKKPKVILLDLKMPKVNGIEVLQKIKSSESMRLVPVVILTSSKEDPDIQKCYSLGANSYIVKPVDFEDFHKVIADLGLYWTIMNQPHS